MVLCHWQDNVWADGTWDAAVWKCLAVVAGTGPRRTGDQILDVLQSFEHGKVSAVAESLQTQRDEDVHTALANAGADEEEVALILYWVAGGF